MKKAAIYFNYNRKYILSNELTETLNGIRIRDILSDFGRFFVHGVAGGNKGNHAARTNLIYGLG